MTATASAMSRISALRSIESIKRRDRLRARLFHEHCPIERCDLCVRRQYRRAIQRVRVVRKPLRRRARRGGGLHLG